MKLAALVAELPHARSGPAADPEIVSVTHDSRRAGKGALFAALPGLVADGRSFLADAVARGAEAALGLAPAPEPISVPYLAVASPRRAAALLAARLCGHPAESLVMVGVTGTSGKTTTTLLLDELLASRHPKRGLFGTLVYRGAGGEAGSREAARTTPEATDLQPMLAALRDEGGTAAVLECSSHALALDRLVGCRFDAAAFLNLSRDHLDYHRDMEDYFEAKALLFGMLKPTGTAVVNATDAFGARLLPRLPRGRAVTFALESRADLVGTPRLLPDRTVLAVEDARGGARYEIESPLLGRPNAENLLAAAAIGTAFGFSVSEIVPALARVRAVPGRLEKVPNRLGLTVLVDYAHKPGALEGVLGVARSLAAASHGRVIVLFGCGGDRDRGKRPEMGRIAVQGADRVFVTSDNPRSEKPEAILEDIRRGVEEAAGSATYLVDREEAIREALRAARAGDVVILAGKGHETTQVASGVAHPFDDRVVAARLLRELEAERA